MPVDLPLLVTLDVAAALLTLVVVAFFVAAWQRTESHLHVLLAVGFLLTALGAFTTSTRAFTALDVPGAWNAVPVLAPTAGALVLFLAYASAQRYGRVRPWEVLAWSCAGVGGLAVGLYAIPWGGERLPDPVVAFTIAHTVQFVAFLVTGGFAALALRQRASYTGLLVPAAFLALALTAYSWVLIDMAEATRLIPFVYVWRFTALGLLLLALALPEPRHADAPEAAPDALPPPEEGPGDAS